MISFCLLRDYLRACPHQALQRWLGLDVGSHYIGLSLSDTRCVIASPLAVYERKSFAKDQGHFIKIIQDYGISLVVVGLPLSSNGDISRQGETTVTFAQKIADGSLALQNDKTEQRVSTLGTIPIVFWDERFSTMVVERSMLAQDMSRKKREKNLDKAAATYILQGALDYYQNSRGKL